MSACLHGILAHPTPKRRGLRAGRLDTRMGFFHFFAGSGVVIHAVGAREYEETLSKAGRLSRPLEVGTP